VLLGQRALVGVREVPVQEGTEVGVEEYQSSPAASSNSA